MDKPNTELAGALEVLANAIRTAETYQAKFAEGTPQHSLQRNRAKALRISRELLLEQPNLHTREELEQALLPVASLMHKSEKTRTHFEAGTGQYRRLSGIIWAMELAQARLTEELSGTN